VPRVSANGPPQLQATIGGTHTLRPPRASLVIRRVAVRPDAAIGSNALGSPSTPRRGYAPGLRAGATGGAQARASRALSAPAAPRVSDR
jgi:hypothetical protein